jgi:nucleoid-associated protein Lsr2
MAQRVTVALEDDLDGGPADETVRFGVGTTEYEIDLNQKNAAKLRARLVPFAGHARRVGRGQPRRAARTGASRQHSAAVRAWAVGQGITISERGRIPASVLAEYEAASGSR